jgi:hypothetical protein
MVIMVTAMVVATVVVMLRALPVTISVFARVNHAATQQTDDCDQHNNCFHISS